MDYDYESDGYDSYDNRSYSYDYEENSVASFYVESDNSYAHESNSLVIEYYNDEDASVRSSTSDTSIPVLQRKDSWEPYDSDDGYRLVIQEVPYPEYEMLHFRDIKSVRSTTDNFYKLSNKSPSEEAFERVITSLLNQNLNEPIARFFIETYGRKDISDIVNISSRRPGRTMYKLLESSSLSQVDKQLIQSVNLCSREFPICYDVDIEADWSNVTPEIFDKLREEVGYVPIERHFPKKDELIVDEISPVEIDASIVDEHSPMDPFFETLRVKSDLDKSLAEESFQYVIEQLCNQEMDFPLAQSLSEHFEGNVDITKVLSMYEEDIDGLFYHKSSTMGSSSSSLSKDESSRRYLSQISKRLVRIIVTFARYRYDIGIPVSADWSQVTLDQFKEYRYKIYNSDINKVPSKPLSLQPDNNAKFNSESTVKLSPDSIELEKFDEDQNKPKVCNKSKIKNERTEKSDEVILDSITLLNDQCMHMKQQKDEMVNRSSYDPTNNNKSTTNNKICHVSGKNQPEDEHRYDRPPDVVCNTCFNERNNETIEESNL